MVDERKAAKSRRAFLAIGNRYMCGVCVSVIFVYIHRFTHTHTHHTYRHRNPTPLSHRASRKYNTKRAQADRHHQENGPLGVQ